ncbi:WEB family protein At1g75720 [Sesamum indicum]|uniref:WEB family protein At1g75720 n=1 Tax=Sesamum indicum TaxID=4182 RepID=A0A6I9TKA6_SESIN|nr:WEB family protein At1g75720 [Sesamum indicum]
MEGGGVKARSKAEIDTSAPFRSVKEAVMLFGERVLAGELYANKLKEMRDGMMDETETSELEQTKQSLRKAREESMQMAQYLSSLQQELQETKMELQRLKSGAFDRYAQLELEIEDLKFIEDYKERTEQVKKETTDHDHDHDSEGVEFQKKKYVTFANPPSVAQVLVPQPPPSEAVLQRHPSLRKKKKKPLIPFIGGIFSKKRGSSEVAMA